MNDQSARLVATRLRALACDMARQPFPNENNTTLVQGFIGAARALESASDPPELSEVLALLRILTAGHTRLCGKRHLLCKPNNDVS